MSGLGTDPMQTDQPNGEPPKLAGLCPICGSRLVQVQEDQHDKKVDRLAAWGCDLGHLFVPGKVVLA